MTDYNDPYGESPAPEPAVVTIGVDSYVTLADADTLAGKRLFANVWTSATGVTRCQALQTATALLDRMHWRGSPLALTQPLAWPRVDDRCPRGSPLSVAVPTEIIAACVELAIHLIGAGQIATPHIQTRMLGDSMTINFPTIADELPKHIRRLIEPHLRVPSANVAEIVL